MANLNNDYRVDFNPAPNGPRKKQTFDNLLEKNIELDNFLTPANESQTRVRCIVCHVGEESIECARATKHLNGPKHIANVKKITNNYTALEKKRAISQFQLVMLNVERNISFLYTNYFMATLKGCIDDSEILKDLQLCRKRAKRIVCDVIAPECRARLREILSAQKFSIIVDESTDVTVEKSMCILVRYYDIELKRFVEVMWDIIKVYENEDSCCDAAQTTDRIITSFAGIPLKNIVCFCSDTCNVMMGGNNSVAAKSKQLIPGIIVYFEKEPVHCKDDTAKNIYNDLCDPLAELYVKFVYFVLSKLTNVNEELQSVATVFNEDKDLMSDLYYNILSLYMDQSYLLNTPLCDVDPLDEKNMKQLLHINVGIDCLKLLHKNSVKFSDPVKIEFFEKAKEFLKTVCVELKKKCDDFSDNEFTLRPILHPKNTLSKNYHENHAPNLDQMFDVYPQFVESDDAKKNINSQWELLCSMDFEDDTIKQEPNIDNFWSMVEQYRNKQNIRCFQDIGAFVMKILLIPNSNASAERLWSKYNLEKTKLRNRLHFGTTRDILFASQLASRIRETGRYYEISDQMISDIINTTTEKPKKKAAKKPALNDQYFYIRDEHSYAIDLLKISNEEEIMYQKRRNPKINYINKPFGAKHNDLTVAPLLLFGQEVLTTPTLLTTDVDAVIGNYKNNFNYSDETP
ncbi:hypothetical protein TKK_0015737 [Trichogramma kaykai]